MPTEVVGKIAATVVLGAPDPKKHSVRFNNTHPEAEVSSIYISRKVQGISNAKRVRITIEVLE